jgi:hypothetical protein
MNLSERIQKYLNEGAKGTIKPSVAFNYLHKNREENSKQNSEFKLVTLKKDGTESKMYDASRHFKNEEEVEKFIENMKQNNPGKTFKYNLYKSGKLVGQK